MIIINLEKSEYSWKFTKDLRRFKCRSELLEFTSVHNDPGMAFFLFHRKVSFWLEFLRWFPQKNDKLKCDSILKSNAMVKFFFLKVKQWVNTTAIFIINKITKYKKLQRKEKKQSTKKVPCRPRWENRLSPMPVLGLCRLRWENRLSPMPVLGLCRLEAKSRFLA
jgi:hypothetical protein